jgi:hypothetical protein
MKAQRHRSATTQLRSQENLVIPRGFESESGEFLTQGFSLQKSVEMYSIKEIPWNGEAALMRQCGSTHVTFTWACLLGDSRSHQLQDVSYILIKYTNHLSSSRALVVISTISRAPQFLFPPTRSSLLLHYVA